MYMPAADDANYPTSWQTTSATHDTLPAYATTGNLTPLRRSAQSGSNVDNLTYTYTAGTNRLASVAETGAGTATETWDAEAGSFTYDANGNVKSAPAPYSITAQELSERGIDRLSPVRDPGGRE